MVSESDFLRAWHTRRVSTIPNTHFSILSSPCPRFVYSRTLLPQKKILRRWNYLFRFCPRYVHLLPLQFLQFKWQSAAPMIGAVVHPIMLNKLINGPVGFHYAVRISAAFNVFLLVVAASFMRTRLPPKEVQQFPVIQWLREPAYLAFVLRYVSASRVIHGSSITHTNL